MKLFARGGHRQRPQHLATNHNFGSATSVTVNTPAGSVGDLLVILVAIATTGADTVSHFEASIAGTSVASRRTVPAAGVLYQVLARIADGTEAGTITVGAYDMTAAGSPLYGEVKRYRPGRALNTTLFGGQTAQQVASTASAPTIPALNPVQPSGVLQGWWLVNSITPGDTVGAPPGGFTTRSSASGAIGGRTLYVVSADEDWPGPSTPGAQALNSAVAGGVTTEWLGLSLFIV